MNFFDRFIIAPFAPGAALRRARQRVALRAFYEAALPSRLHKTRTDKKSANAQNERAAGTLRIQARHLEENLDIAKGALDVLVNNTVGSGIQPEPQVLTKGGEPATEFNEKLLKLWDDWIYCPEVTRQYDYYSLQRLAARSCFRDGEVFGQRLTGSVAKLDHNTIVPYSLEMLEADYVPLDFTDRSRDIIQGIEVNAWGQPRAYYVYKTHPGDSGSLVYTQTTDTKRIAADRVLHLKMALRLHQLRGITVFASVLSRFDDLKEIDESERVAARVAAAMAAYIKKGNADSYDPPATGSDGRPELRSMEMVPGMIFDDLMPGEEIGTISPNRPNNALIDFRDSQLRSAAAGIGASFSSLAKNYDGTYSAQRQELVEQYVAYRTLSAAFIYRFCQPVWDGFVEAAIASGAVELAGVDEQSIYDCTHAVPQMPWIDPQKEAEANAILLEHGFKSRSRIIRETGQKPGEVRREIQQDAKAEGELGLEFGPKEPAAPGEDAEEESGDQKPKPRSRAARQRKPKK